MTLRKTIFLIGHYGEVITVTIYTAENLKYQRGIWDVDTNTIVLTEEIYQQFDVLKNHSEQRRFFDDLLKVSGTLLA
jgi:hypothetical protein